MKIKIATLSIIAALSFSSCEKALDVQPKNSLSPAVALADVDGYQALLISVYDRLQSYSYWGRDMALEGDALADNIFTVTTQASGRYTGANTNARGSHYNFWDNAYGAINELNTIIAGIDAITPPASKAQLKIQVKAEALALRGMIYFDLARVYGYEPTKIPTTGPGAGFNKSAVLRLKPTAGLADANTQPRATIAEVYASIESDFNASFAVFATLTTKKTTVFRMNEAAAHGLLGKVFLYEEKWAQAITEFDKAIDPNLTSAILAPAGTINAEYGKVPHSESLFEINYNQATEVAGVTGSNDAPYTYTQPRTAAFNTFGGQTPSDELVALFEAGDDRRALIFSSTTTTSGATAYNWVNKYRGAGGPYTDNTKVIRYADILLMKAEALAETNAFAPAVAVLTTLRNARNASIAAIPTDANIKAFIQIERRRELFFEGHRWFDLKRKGAGITKPAKTAVQTIAPDDYRILAPLPNAAVTFNPALPQNPNY